MKEISSSTKVNAYREQRCLWKPYLEGTSSTPDDNSPLNASYDAIYSQFAVQPKKTQRSLFRYVANSIVVLQECVLSCYFFGWHRFLVLQQRYHTKTHFLHPHHRFLLDASTMIMYVALLLAVIFNGRAVTLDQDRTNRSTTHHYASKASYRIVDALILATVLRYVAALLHNLTISYSTDTVELLAAAAMIVHVLFCDYSYANGYRRHKVKTANGHIGSLSPDQSEYGSMGKNLGVQKQFIAMDNHRPSFMGGTLSLNAAFFATILLVSRLEESYTVTSTSSFAFVSLSIVLFAYYPLTRHTISVIYPPFRSGVHWLITAAVTISTSFLLHLLDDMTAKAVSSEESFVLRKNAHIILFVAMFLILGIFVPMWKQYMARFKVLLRGQWDIPRKASMNLEYMVPSS